MPRTRSGHVSIAKISLTDCGHILVCKYVWVHLQSRQSPFPTGARHFLYLIFYIQFIHCWLIRISAIEKSFSKLQVSPVTSSSRKFALLRCQLNGICHRILSCMPCFSIYIYIRVCVVCWQVLEGVQPAPWPHAAVASACKDASYSRKLCQRNWI